MSHVTKPIPLGKIPVTFKERPWGCFSQYAFNQDCTVSLMTVKPGQRLSLQSHTARIPANARHRLTCTGPHSVRVLEIAFGNWQQSDITRYEDDYARAAAGE